MSARASEVSWKGSRLPKEPPVGEPLDPDAGPMPPEGSLPRLSDAVSGTPCRMPLIPSAPKPQACNKRTNEHREA